jgi:beta-N-acetylhexosaminidase
MKRDRIEQRAARVLTVGFRGTAIPPELHELLQRGIGGVILFARNVGSPRDTLALVRELKQIAPEPLLVSVDQEGGSVARLRAGFTTLPSLRSVGRTKDAQLTRELGGVIGRELRAVGIDLDFAPVLDVDTNPLNPVIGARSLGAAPALVAELGVALALGLDDAGVAACGKHFPGHGDTIQDSHLALPRLSHTLERLRQVELVPFQAAACAGIAAIMTAHVVFEALDPQRPATLSGAVVGGLLRRELSYDGLVVSDDLEMQGVAAAYSIEDAVVLGLGAGVDHFLICHSAERAARAIDAIIRARERGELESVRLEAAERRFERVLSGYFRPAPDEQALEILGCAAHLAVVERIAKQSERDDGTATDPTSR